MTDFIFFFFQAEDGIRDLIVTGVQTCALPISILMLTAVNDATSAALCMQRGAMDYLTKPIELADLGRAVQRALKRREMLLENRQLNQWLKEEVSTRTAELQRDRKSVV